MNVYDMINTRIMELLQQNIVPWHRPWNNQTSFPMNLISKRPYKGINVWLTACQQYESPYWLTYKQATELGGHVKRGMKSTPVIYFQMLDKKDSVSTDGDTGTNGKIPLLKYYSVFNTDQCEGITIPELPTTTTIFNPIQTAEEIIFNMPNKPLIQHMGNKATYNVRTDTVTLPPQTAFESPEEYYSTAYHELTHATMAEHRLNRKASIQVHKFGDEDYSKEELVAEMGAAFLCGHTGIGQKTLINSVAYLQGWLKALKNDKTLLIHAAAQGQKAADYILNLHPDHQEEPPAILSSMR